MIDMRKKVVIDEGGIGNKVPFWLAKGIMAIPTSQFMANELKRYLDSEFMICINEFNAFKEQNYEVIYENPSISVEAKNSVVVRVEFPVQLKKGDLVMEGDEFIYSVPIDLGLIADKANEIAFAESVNKFLEEHTRSLISLYSGLDESLLPPFSQSLTNLDCSRVSWQKEDIKKRLKNIFSYNFEYLSVEGTNYKMPETSDPVSKGVYESFVYDIFKDVHEDLEVDFSYKPEWEFIDYNIKPSRGDSLLPYTVRQNNIPFVGTMCVFDYKFKYTVDFPVLVEVKDGNSAKIDPISGSLIENEGYKLQYFLDSYLCGNQERICTGRATGIEINGSPVFEPVNDTELQDTFFCDSKQKVSGDININVVDSVTNQGLSGVNIYYRCGSQLNDCWIGKTDDSGKIESKFPYCINGVVYFNKRDYPEVIKELTVFDKEDRILTILMGPIKEFEVEVKKIHLPTLIKNYHDNGILDVESVLSDVEGKVLITGKGKNSIAYMYPDPGGKKIKLGEGEYELSASLFENIYLPASEYEGKEFNQINGNYLMGMSEISFDLNKDRD